MIKLIGTIFILSCTSAFGQGVLRPTFELIDYKVTDDTLTLVSADKFLYYPFGIFSEVKKLKQTYSELYKEKEGASYLIYEDSYVKFFYDDDKKTFEIVYARISNPNFRLTNGARTGMTKKELFSKFFVLPPDNMDNIKILKLESAVLGIWHYYKFDKDVLTSFYLDTDYQLDKN